MSKSAKRSNNFTIGASAKVFCRRKGRRPKVPTTLAAWGLWSPRIDSPRIARWTTAAGSVSLIWLDHSHDLPRHPGGAFLSAEKTMENRPLSRIVYIVLICAAFAYVVFWYGYAINAIVAARW
jgi:hypothetical protein